MRYSRKSLLATLAVIFLTGTLLLANGGGVYAEGGTFPGSPFNGMQTTYTISGASIISSTDSAGFTYSRTMKGNLGTGQLRVSGSAKMGSGYYADVVVQVWAGAKQQQWKARIPTGWPGFNSQSFDVAVDIPAGATSGGFSIDMTGVYNAGTRGVVVSGTFAGAPVATATSTPLPTATATPVPPTAIPTPTATPTKPVPCTLSLEDQVRRSNELYLKSFDGTCLGQVVSLGDAGTFQNAMEGVQVQQDGGYTPSYLDGRMRLQVKPCDGNLQVGAGANETAWHETMHRLEHLNGDFDSPNASVEGYADRNADYVTILGALLNEMRNLEAQAKKGASADQLGRVWQRLQDSFVRGNPVNPFAAVPDLDQLQRWTGFRARIDEIRNIYLNGCAGEAMKQAVLSVPEPPAYISPGGITVGAPEPPAPTEDAPVPEDAPPTVPGEEPPGTESGPLPEDVGPGETPVEF
ncbi:MAG: hypothetical protein M1531_02060 [Chloroflexi bacterium]|nr:hypothetical protein [Chloroflexota bacterium]